MNRYHLVHATEFRYDGPVSESYNEVRLRPIHDETQSCLSFRLLTDPVSRGTSYRDSFGNWVHQFNILPEHHHLKIEAESVVLAHDIPALPTGGMKLSELEDRREELEEEFLDFIIPTGYVPHVPQLDELIDAASRSSDGTVSGFVKEASFLIHEKFKYVKGATHVNSSIQDSLAVWRGSLPGFRALASGSGPQTRPARAICLRLPGAGKRGIARRQIAGSDRGIRVACLGGSLLAGFRLDRS